jgi:hypothetical protein
VSIDGFEFEGRQVTARQLKREGLCYSEGTIQSALEAGCKTMGELVTFAERRLAVNTRRSYVAGRRAMERALARGAR